MKFIAFLIVIVFLSNDDDGDNDGDENKWIIYVHALCVKHLILLAFNSNWLIFCVSSAIA